MSLDTVRNLEKPPLAPLRLLLDVPEAVLFDLDVFGRRHEAVVVGLEGRRRGVVGAEVTTGSSLLETAGSIASKVPSTGTVSKTGAATYATGYITSRVFRGETVGDH